MALRDILAGVEPEKSVPKRGFETAQKALLSGRISNQAIHIADGAPKVIGLGDDTETKKKFAA
jgi:hypothetical protein